MANIFRCQQVFNTCLNSKSSGLASGYGAMTSSYLLLQSKLWSPILTSSAQVSGIGIPQRKSRESLYECLDVPLDATLFQIKSSYNRLSIEYNPDLYKHGSQPEAAIGKLAAIKEAYEIIGNYQKKKLVDSGLLFLYANKSTPTSDVINKLGEPKTLNIMETSNVNIPPALILDTDNWINKQRSKDFIYLNPDNLQTRQLSHWFWRKEIQVFQIFSVFLLVSFYLMYRIYKVMSLD